MEHAGLQDTEVESPMDVWRIVAEWPQVDAKQQHQWTQYIRFASDLTEEDVPALIQLYKMLATSEEALRRIGEEAILTALTRVASPRAIPLFREVLFDPAVDSASPPAEIVFALGEITRVSNAADGYALLEACLAHPHVDVRDMATTALVRAYQHNGRPVPERVVRTLYTLMEGDGTRRVRFSAGLALQELGELDLIDVIFWSEEMAGWEEHPYFDLEDDLY